jgi:hypothetical protein
MATGIVATIGTNLAHGLGHGPIGGLIGAWPALALVGSYELLMLLVRSHHKPSADCSSDGTPTANSLRWNKTNRQRHQRC